MGEILKNGEYDAAVIANARGKEAALKYLIDIMKQEKFSPPVLLEKAAAYAMRLGHYKLAEKLVDLSLSASETRSQSLHFKALILNHTGREVEAFEFAKRAHTMTPLNKDAALMYALGLAAQEKYEDMLHVIQPFLERIQSGKVSTLSGHEFIALQSACLGKIAAKPFRKGFTIDPHLQNIIGELAKEYRDELGIKSEEPQKPKLEYFTPWERRLAAAYKKCHFWDIEPLVPVDRVAARVTYSARKLG